MVREYAILLVRVSTHQQDFEAQINDLKKEVETKGFIGYKVISTKETGLADFEDKIGTNEMFRFIENNPQYNTVVATEMSRLGRRQSTLQIVKEWLHKNQVQLYVKDSSFKLLDDDGNITQSADMAFTMYALLSESEIRQKKERFLRQRKDLMSQGFSISGKLLFGYDRTMASNKKNTLIVNEQQAEQIRKIYNWYLNGFDGVLSPSIKEISRHCIKEGFHPYTKSKRNVNKLLKEQGYTGHKLTNNPRKNPKFGKVKGEPSHITTQYEIKYPIIISNELFTAVQYKLKSNVSKATRKDKHTTLLASLIKCKSCNRYLSGNYRFQQLQPRHSYRCTSRTDTQPCDNKISISMQLMDNSIWSLVKTDLKGFSKIIKDLNPDVEKAKLEVQKANLIHRDVQLKEEVKAIERKLNSMSSFTNIDMGNIMDSIITRMASINSEIGSVKNDIANIESKLLMVYNKEEDIHEIVSNNLEQIESDKTLLKQYINKFVDRIDILQQERSLSVIKVTFKYFSLPDFMDLVKERKPTGKEVYLVVDKRVTRQIKIARLDDFKLFDIDRTEQLEELLNDVKNKNNEKLTFVKYTQLKI